MAIDKIELHEVEVNTKQIAEASTAIKSLQDDLEATLDEYVDVSERFSNGEISKKEFDDLTKSKNEHVSSVKEKLDEHFKVFSKSLVVLNKVLSQTRKDVTTALAPRKEVKKKKHAKTAGKKLKK